MAASKPTAHDYKWWRFLIGINALLFLYIVIVARDTNNIDSRPPGAVGWIRTNGSFRYTPLAGERTRPTMRLRHMAGDDRIELSHFGSEPNTLPLG